MNKLLKKIASGFTSLVVCTSLVAGTVAVAEEENVQTFATGPAMSIEFLGRGSTPAQTNQGYAQLSSNDENKEFWIGVAVDDISTLPLFANGVASVDVAFEYNPKYVKPYWSSNDADADWQTALESGNLKSGTNKGYWNSDYFEITSVREVDIDTSQNDRENASEASQRVTDGWKMCYVGVTLNASAPYSPNALRFFDTSSDDDRYLIKIPFTLVSAPKESDPDQNPTVLSLIRGKDTLAVGGYYDMATPLYASWYATERPAPDDTNLKNLFTFGGDISLFGQGGAIEDIVPFKAVNGDAPRVDYTLSQDAQLNEEGYSAEQLYYYLSVPNETESISFEITSSSLPTVTYENDTQTTPTSVTVNTGDQAKEYVTDAILLDELTQNDQYNNTVTVSDGTKTYTIYIRRLLKPQIKLNYGNSPYGEIMRADNIPDADKQTAKDKFNENNKFNANYLPTGMSAKVYYSPNAWAGETSPDKNFDRDETALFAFEYQNFTDPGFVATDSLGNVVDNSKITRKIEVCVLPAKDMKVTIVPDMMRTYTVDGDSSNDEFTTAQLTGASKAIMPDAYDLEYSFYDDNLSETVTQIRKVIILPIMCDTNLDSKISTGDLTPIKNWTVNIFSSVDSSVQQSTYNLFLYRVMDTNYDTKISTGDLTAIKNSTVNIAVVPYYVQYTK